MTTRRASRRWGAGLVVASALVVAGCGRTSPMPAPSAATTAEPTAETDAPAARALPREPSGPAPVPAAAPLVEAGLDLRAGPVPVPISLHLPTLGLEASVLGVGLDDQDAMDAPTGGLDDPVWDQAFWYRGSAEPGAPSTALIAGHVGSRGGPGVFAHLGRLVPGDPIVVEDLRSGQGVRFVVTETTEYSLADAARPEVMTRIYGAGPVAGTWPQPSADGLAHLTLVTCAGTFSGVTHDHRRVVYAVRA